MSECNVSHAATLTCLTLDLRATSKTRGKKSSKIIEFNNININETTITKLKQYSLSFGIRQIDNTMKSYYVNTLTFGVNSLSLILAEQIYYSSKLGEYIRCLERT